MAEIQPFHALRFTEQAGSIASLVCPLRSTVNKEERRALLQKNLYNIIRLELPQEGEDPCATAGETLKSWISGGILRRDTDPGLYLCEEEFSFHGEMKKAGGFFCLARLDGFSLETVMGPPYGKTVLKAKQDRLRLMEATACEFSPVCACYEDKNHATRTRLEALSSGEPRYEFLESGVTHRMWLINDPVAIRAIQEDFMDRELHPADEEFLSETALEYRTRRREIGNATGGEDYVMTFLIDRETVCPEAQPITGGAAGTEERMPQEAISFFQKPVLGLIINPMD